MNKAPGGPVAIKATLLYYQSAGQVEWYWRIFRQPFWHVAVVLHTPRGDIVVDPRMSYVSVSYDLPAIRSALYVQKVHILVDTSDPPWATFAFGSCVTIAKALLGIRAWWVFTPQQLYRYIRARRCFTS